MPLHPRIAALLEATAHLPRPPAVSVEVARRTMRERTRLLPAATEALHSVTDLELPGPAGALRARLYRPLGKSPHPLLVFFHGGGFVIGDLDTHDTLCRRLCAGTPCVVLAVDYRLAPEHPYPAAAEDCWAATVWAARNATSLGSDRSCLSVGGDSAGGTLAVATALHCRDQGGPALRAQVLLYPALAHYTQVSASYAEMAKGYGLTREAMIWFWDHYLPRAADRLDPYAVPAAGTCIGLPPSLILSAEYDVLRDEAEDYATRLDSAGVPVRMRRCIGMNHGFAALGGWLDEADQALQEVSDWLRFRSSPDRA